MEDRKVFDAVAQAKAHLKQTNSNLRYAVALLAPANGNSPRWRVTSYDSRKNKVDQVRASTLVDAVDRMDTLAEKRNTRSFGDTLRRSGSCGCGGNHR